MTVVGVAVVIATAIERPEYLSAPLMPFALLFSAIFVGLPLGLGLVAVQYPAFEWSLGRTRSEVRAWLVSFFANAAYAAMLTGPLITLGWLLGHEPSWIGSLRAMLLLIGCSLVTSAVWLCCNHLLSRTSDV